jgi:hypothetical protein
MNLTVFGATGGVVAKARGPARDRCALFVPKRVDPAAQEEHDVV